MILGRNTELKYLENYYEKEGSQLIILYGRKNVGKTHIVKEFCQNKSYLYYQARQCSELEQLNMWSREMREDFPALKIDASFHSIFAAITEAKSRKKIIVIDEFQYIVKTSSAFIEEVVELLHNQWNNQPVMIIMISSSIGWVENTMVSKMKKAAYEITGLLKISELKFLDVVRRFPNYTLEQCVETYGILGGVPGLWKYWNGNLDVPSNICKNILRQGVFLCEEGGRYVSQELREVSVYQTILAALAADKNKLNDLYKQTEYSRAKISVYLKNLMELQIIEKVFSFDTAGKEHTLKGVYQICNHYVYFWFKYIFPNLSKLNVMTEEMFYKKYIYPSFKSYTAFFYKKMCMEYLEMFNQMGKLEFRYEKSGSWVGKIGTIDIVAEDEEGNTLVGLCSWEAAVMTYEDYEWLLLCTHKAKLQVDYYYFFTRGDFDERIKAEAAMNPSIHLISLGQM